MGKKSGITKAGRMMNPADRERKQLRAKELKRNKKQRTQVRHAIVKNRDPEGLIEQMSRLDDQEFDPQRQLALTVIQEKRNKLRGAFYQIIGLHRQEKEDKQVKSLEKMMYEYEVERSRKEENFRAQIFSESANFEEIPLPSGASGPDAASTPFSANLLGTIGPQQPSQLQAAMKAGILKKSTSSTAAAKKKHKYPPGPPPGVPPPLYDSDEEEDEGEADKFGWEEERRKRVRFGEQPRRRPRRADDEQFGEEGEDGEDDGEDYAPVEIPDGMLTPAESAQQQNQPVYARPVPSLAAPAVGSGPIMPRMAPPPPAHPPFPGYPMPAGHRPPLPSQQQQMAIAMGQQQQQQQQHSKTGLIGGPGANYTPIAPPPSDPHPSAVISAGPQVVMPRVTVPVPLVPDEKVIISGAPQMRNIKREATRFVPTAVKIQRPLVASTIGPRIPASAGSKLVPPRTTTTAAGQRPKTGKGAQQPGAGKSVDQACDDFLKELEGLL